MVVLLPNMRDERRLLDEEKVDQAPQHGRRVAQPCLGGLAEEIGQAIAGFLLQFVNDAAQQHRLALARIAFDPEQLALWIVTPSPKFVIIEDPAVRVPKQAALCSFDARLVVSRVGLAQVFQALLVPVVLVSLFLLPCLVLDS
ncbi:hypothetical protein CEP51_014088 [Fusarium floridanum]|uniref:Uncharacterized protein n=1 Tax=Fusarium floridanum TaxID=1325733 RepID=A0A428PZ38_9HYPO|nr:hypothetical protein CEP51_014088 [Fusarium floridanum]